MLALLAKVLLSTLARSFLGLIRWSDSATREKLFRCLLNLLHLCPKVMAVLTIVLCSVVISGMLSLVGRLWASIGIGRVAMQCIAFRLSIAIVTLQVCRLPTRPGLTGSWNLFGMVVTGRADLATWRRRLGLLAMLNRASTVTVRLSSADGRLDMSRLAMVAVAMVGVFVPPLL